jgi:hypothetical protein
LELDVIVLHCLHVEPDRWDCGDDLPHLQPIEYGGLAGIVEAEDQDAGLAVAEERREEPREHDAHGDARGLAPAAALGIRSSELGAGRDLGFCGRDGGRSGGRGGKKGGSELARASRGAAARYPSTVGSGWYSLLCETSLTHCPPL